MIWGLDKRFWLEENVAELRCECGDRKDDYRFLRFAAK